MNKILHSFIFLLFACSISFGQEIDTIRIYAGNFSQVGNTYTINDKIVEKDVFDNYFKANQLAKKCCPCIVRMFNFGDTLLYEDKRCHDTINDWFKGYYPNGNLMNLSHYSITENQNGIYSIGIGDKYSKDGTWIFYNVQGDTSKVEVWNKGTFISESPKIDSSEIWGITITYERNNILTNDIIITNFKRFKFKPFYKTKNKTAELKLNVRITDSNNRSWSNSLTPKELRKLQIDEVAGENDIELNENTLIWITFTSNSNVFGGKIFKYH